MSRALRPRAALGMWIILLLVVAACGAPPTVEQETAAEGGPSDAAAQGENASGGGDEGAGAAGLDAVYAEVEGLEGEERRQRLTEMAAEEGGTLTMYTSTNLDESGPLSEDFTDATDVDVEIYRAGSESILQRLLQEDRANFAGADVVATNGPELTILDSEGMFLPLTTPATDDIVEFGVFDNWASQYLNVFVSAWNTDAVPQGEEPASWEEVLTGTDKRLAMELGDYDWFATLVTYFEEEQGMSEDEAVEMFREASRNAIVVDGHTVMAELMAAGEFDITTSSYQHRIDQLADDGAPLAWQPAVAPIIARPNGVAVHKDTDAPASALLYAEYLLTDGQERLLEFDRTPASTVAGGGLPDDIEALLVDVKAVIEDRDKWETLYEEVVRESGSEVIEE